MAGGLTVAAPAWAPDGEGRETLAAYLARVHARWLAQEPHRRWRTVDGSLLFADVSGFTALSERLARRGPVGAELLSDLIKSVVGGMLASVSANDGDVLKFGGDALLVLFEGDGHSARACAAADGIRAGLRRFQGVQTEAGKVTLRISSGVMSGPIDLFLAGSEHRELIVAGPGASEVVAMESAAGPGEVVISPGTAAAVPAECAGAPCGPGVLLRRVPPLEAIRAPEAPTHGLDPLLGLPAHLHDHHANDGEHRIASVGFIQLRGVDALLRDEGPEALADALDERVSAAQLACRDQQVTFMASDVDADACKLILLAGAPAAVHDGEDRLLHALRAAVTSSGRLTARAGASRGRLFALDVGSGGRQHWTVFGDVVNQAARVMGKAPVGGVLATAETLAATRDDFVLEHLEPFAVKGKKDPIRAALVGEARGRRDVARAEGLVGRQEELALLRDALADAEAGQLRAAELVGEPGMGKTHLARALLAEAAGHMVLTIECGPYGARNPYLAVRGPLRELLGVDPADDAATEVALRAVVEHLRPDLLDWLPLLALPFGLELPATAQTAALGAEFSRARLHEAMAELLDALPQPALLVVFVDDAHWLDDASSALLAHVVAELPDRPVLLLATRRAVEGGLHLSGERALSIQIEALAPEAAQALVALDGQLDLETERAILERARGNPMFLRELRAAAQTADTAGSLPDTIETLIAARIDELPAPERSALRQAAVLGLHVSTELLEAVVEGHEPIDRLLGLEEFMVSEGPGRIGFRHPLIREAAYQALPFRRRRELHARAADLIAAAAGDAVEDQAEELVQHEHAAHRWDGAWRYGQVAGERALRRAAPVEAVDFLSIALAATDHLPSIGDAERAAAAERLGDAAQLAGRNEVAGDAYARARRARADDPVAVAELCRKQGWVCERSKHYSNALRWYTRGLTRLEGEAETEDVLAVRGRLACSYGAIRVRQGQLRTAIPHVVRATEIAEGCGDRATLAHAYYLLDWIHTDLGLPGAQRFRDLALPIYEELGDETGQAKVLNNLGANAFWEGRWNDAIAFYERSMQMNERVGDVVQAAIVRHNIAEIRIDQGRLDEAVAMLTDVLRTWRGSDYRVGVAYALSNLGRAATRAGDLAHAEERLTEARERFAALGAGALELETQAREAERLVAARRPGSALALVGRVRETAHGHGAPPALLAMLQRVAGWAKVQQGHREDARVRFAEALELARSVDAGYEEALALEALGRLSRDETDLQAAAAILDRLGVVACLAIPSRV